MWGRIYPHAGLLIFANIILRASCKGSLTFLIDETESMSDDIKQVRSSVNRISDVVFNEKSSLISNMVLVTFNDPDAQVRVVTEDRNTFKRTLDTVYAHNIDNHDCWEPSMNGLLLALDKSNRNSFIYVFTDAPAKDYKDGQYVKEMCQKKQTQIFFVLTGHCYGYYKAQTFDVYFDIAQACSGLAFDVSKNDVEEVLKTIEEVIKGNKAVIRTDTVPAGVKKNIPFTIDDHTDYAIVSVSGKNVYLKITGPSANLEKIMWNNNGKVAKLSNTKPGTYVATVMGQTKTSVVIVGRTDFFFNHGFSELRPKSLGDTSLQPIADANVHLSISVTDDHHTVKIVSAQILDMNENPMESPMPLTEISKDFYVTAPFVAPSQRFKVAVNGIVKATGKPIKRIGKIPITPAEPPKILPTNTKPTVEIAEGKAIEIEYNSMVKLTCKVVAFPEPKIEWFNNNGGLMPSKMSLQEYPYKYISYMDISYAYKGGKYKCYAVNDIDRDWTTIDVVVKEPITVISAPPGITKLTYGTEATITCDITSQLPVDIHWHYANEMTGQTTEIETSDKYVVSANRTQLKIKKMDLDLVGRYTCKASLKNKKVVEKSFFTRVKIDGLIAPKVQGGTEIKITKGKTATFECKVVSGLPAPKITWQFGGKTDSKFTPLAGSESVLRITNVEDKHNGKYKCVAENVAGKDEHVTTLFVQEVPQVSGVTAKTVRLGMPASIECTVEGEPKPTVTWQFMDISSSKFLPTPGTDKVLNIPRVEIKHAGRYKCVAKNEVGNNEHVTTLEVQDVPKILPSDSAIYQSTEGDATLRIPCVASGLPKPSITWKLNGRVIKPSEKYSIEDGTLIIQYPKVSDTNSYTCEVKNELGANSATFKTYIRQVPRVSGVTAKTVRLGMPASIECTVEGEPKPTVTWQFMDISSSKFVPTPGTDKVLNIPRVEIKHAGRYKCVAKNEVGNNEHVTTLEVQDVPKILPSDSAIYQSTEGDATLRIPCVASGLPKPSITWKLNGRVIKSSEKYSIENGTLIIRNPKVSDTNSYTCEVKNELGANSATFKTYIRHLPIITTKSSVAYQATEGDAFLRIPCAATGVPKPVIVWKLSGRYITRSAKYSIEDGTLIIRDPKRSDPNSYTCEAKNEVGAASATFKTYIYQHLKISGVASKNVILDTPASIECNILKGEPKPRITWQFMEKSASKYVPIAGSENTLHLSSAKKTHAGSYKCVARNSIGSDEHVTMLIVEYLPEFTTTSSMVYQATEGDALLRIPCAAAGVPEPVIVWKLSGRNITTNAKYAIEDGTLIILNPKVTDTNSYTCEAKNELGANSATFKAYIRQPPHVSGVTDKKVRLGMPASIECTVEGEPKPIVTWQFMDISSSKFLPTHGTDNVLNIPRVEIKHAGRYKCVAKNEVGNNEHITTIEVQDMPKILPSISAIYRSTEGEALLRIPCVASGLPKPSITWKLNNRVINPSEKYSIEDGTLIIRNPKVSDANSYTCEAKNELGEVSATFKTYISQAPQVSGVTAKKARLGMPASIECTVEGEPKPTVTWQFMDISSSKFLATPGTDNVLNIPRVEIKHAGRYKCVAKNEVGNNEHVTTLEVQDMPKILTVSTNYRSTEGDASLRIPCVASGLPKPSITWKLNGPVIQPSTKYSMKDGTLIIRVPNMYDTNSYTCEARNEVGAASATFRTYIQQHPQLSGVASKNVILGTPASIECKIVKGEPKPRITWQFMSQSASKYVPIAGSENILRLSSPTKTHAGSYKCVARNNIGSDEHVTTVIVTFAPEITKHSTTVEGIEGDLDLRVPCVVDGIPKPVITWKLKGATITPGEKYSIQDGTLIIRDPKVSDTKSYTCEAKNEVGAVSAMFRTYIQQHPKLSGVASKNVILGTPASIECKIVKGEPKPKITWQFMDKSASKYVPIAGSENTLRLSNPTKTHAGSYKCVARNNIGSDEHVTTVIVAFAPEITKHSTTVEGIEGDLALRIPCDVIGIPKPVITWKLKGATITSDSKYIIEDGALVIMKPTEKDSSMYTCEAKNYVSTVSATFQVTVKKLPTNFGTEHFVYLLEGETKKLKCDAYSSASQSVKWFITKVRPRASDWSLSATSSPRELESSETTNASSKDYSSTSTITKDAGIKEPYIQIAKASSTDHDGKYTCRVSDKHGNTQTHTYVVDVGSAPEFHYDATSLDDWQGFISHITQNCDIREDVKPKPVVEWIFNGKVLTDLSSAGVGHYTCNVSNVHGSVQRSFDVKSSACLISRNAGYGHKQYMPLVLDGKGFWHKLENTEHYTVVEQDEKITLSCPSQKNTLNTFKNFPKKNTLQALCHKEDSFEVEGIIYKLSDLQCTHSIRPSVIRKKVKCLSETSELLRVGYNLPGFLEAYEVCFDTEKNMPLYTRIIMTETNNNGLSAGYNWHSYPGIGNKKTERGFTCKDTMSSCCYSKSQLVNAIDFNDGPAKKSSFIDPLNVVPVWLPCDTSKPTWESINDMVRSVLPIYTDLVTWSGTHTLQEKNGAVIPRYLWKVVRLYDDEAVAIVHVNDPEPIEKDIKCKTQDICDKYDDWFTSSDKYTYCCSLPDFFESFEIHESGIGESMDAVLDEIEKST